MKKKAGRPGLSVKRSVFGPPTTQSQSREPVNLGLRMRQPGMQPYRTSHDPYTQLDRGQEFCSTVVRLAPLETVN